MSHVKRGAGKYGVVCMCLCTCVCLFGVCKCDVVFTKPFYIYFIIFYETNFFGCICPPPLQKTVAMVPFFASYNFYNLLI